MSKKKDIQGGLVYSTNNDYFNNYLDQQSEDIETLPKQQQKLRVRFESKHRAGKTVTVVLGFVGKDEDRKELGKLLKQKCGTGGSVKDDEIIIQGNYVYKIVTLLKEMGYTQAK